MIGVTFDALKIVSQFRDCIPLSDADLVQADAEAICDNSSDDRRALRVKTVPQQEDCALTFLEARMRTDELCETL
jgi:hypothetical protein